MSLTDQQLSRYARHIILKEVGGAGQGRLLGARVAVLGAGGIGAPALQALAGAGVGTLVVIDDDVVELSNLQRQTLFGSDDLAQPKAAAAAAAIARLNPDVRVETHQVRLDVDNAESLIAGCDVILDGSDNFAARLALANAALTGHIPLVSAAVAEFEGQLGVFRGWEADKPCYRCFVGGDPERVGVSCSEQGVLGAMTAVMGSLAALEVLRQITGFGEDAAGKLMLVDALAFRFRTITLPKDPGCPACSQSALR